MDSYYTEKSSKTLPAECEKLSRISKRRLQAFLSPLLNLLSEVLDKRLVRTFYLLSEVLSSLSKSRHSLQITTLGCALLGAFQSRAGMKRIHRLLDSDKWEASLLIDYIKQTCKTHIEQIPDKSFRLLLWDDSQVEKHETIHGESLCPVRSSKFKRLIRIRPDYYNPPTKSPAFVAGMHWIGLVACGLQSLPMVYTFDFWSTRGASKDKWFKRHLKVLIKVNKELADSVIHVFDRGFCGKNWISVLLQLNCRFLIRWNGGYNLYNEKGELKKTYRHSLGKKAVSTRKVWDMKRKCYRKAGVLFMKVIHPYVPEQTLYLVICRPGKKGQSPWYLITSEPVENAGQAWRIVFAYSRRWLIEMAFRFNKSEMGIESIRVTSWEKRIKLIAIITVIYAFLLSLLMYGNGIIAKYLFIFATDRKQKRYREASIPLYHLREILDFLWNQIPSGKFG